MKMRVRENMMGALIDWFGKKFRIVQETKAGLIISVVCNKLAMRYWALQYGEYAEVLEPESLRDEIREVVDCMASFYR